MLTLNHVSAGYGKSLVLDDLRLTLDEAVLVGIIGPNGAGKSTLLKVLVDLLPYTGEVRLFGSAISQKQKRLAYVAQKANVDATFPIRVRDCVALGVTAKLGFWQRLRPDHWQKVDKALAQVGLQELAKRQISQLSGGQFQRMLLARALVQEADVFLLDEPFVGVDQVSECCMMAVLRELRQSGKLIIIVHHDLHKVKAYFDKVILLNHKLMAYGDVATTFNRDNLVKTYGYEDILGE